MDDTLGLSPTSELDAVNAILFGIGESPVGSLDDLSLTDAAQALTLLRRESRALQAKGWNFNTEEELRLQPDATDGTVTLPANAVGTTFTRADKGAPFAVRAGKVYNRRAQSFAIGRPVTADVVVLLAFEDLPEVARRFITIRAGRMYQDAVLGDQGLHQFEAQDEIAAWAEFLSREAEDCGYNINRDSPSVRDVTINRGSRFSSRYVIS